MIRRALTLRSLTSSVVIASTTMSWRAQSEVQAIVRRPAARSPRADAGQFAADWLRALAAARAPLTADDATQSYHPVMSQTGDRLQQALALENETERKLAVVSLIDEQVRRIEWRAIVIGGLAVEFWTHGAYSTTDIDLYLPHGPAVDDLLAELGFRREGRHWVLPEHKIFVEAPASFPAESEEVHEITLRSGFKVLLLSPEDVLIDRLHQFVSGGHRDVASQALSLLDAEDLDRQRLGERADEEGLTSALAALFDLEERVKRGKPIETWELQEIAKRLQREP
jgi:hypothetical protein